ncbi:hypothetical protein F2Q69_00015422 [Brassica cretica]|uniref:Uncharacterized protein n=1 Tax=Brassica cretica TaxID=69181 RepID=A0A8S9R6D5_BRACR|nr:hypothetical protein F2Q69_00015422 [Brassica cretica]
MTVGLPEAEMEAGANLFRDLSSNLRIFFTRGFELAAVECTAVGGGDRAREGFEVGGSELALLVWRGELDLGGKTVKFAGRFEFSLSVAAATVVSDLVFGSVSETLSKTISVSALQIVTAVVAGPAAECCWTVLEGFERAESVEKTEALERLERGMVKERGGYWAKDRWG